MDKVLGLEVIESGCFRGRPCRDPLTVSTLFRGALPAALLKGVPPGQTSCLLPPFLYQQGTDAPVTVAGMFPGQGYNPLGQSLSFFTGLLGPVAVR